MSYTPAAGNALNFQFPARTYSPPSGNAVDLNFGALLDAEINCVGGVSTTGSFDIRHGVSVGASDGVTLLLAALFLTDAPGVAAGPIKIGGEAVFCRGTSLSCSGTATLYGQASIITASNVQCVGGIRVNGTAVIVRGVTVSTNKRINLAGCGQINAGRSLSASGALPMLHGGSTLRHGTAFRVHGTPDIRGKAAFLHLGSHTLIAEGLITLGGRLSAIVKKEIAPRSLSVFVRPAERIEVIHRGL